MKILLLGPYIGDFKNEVVTFRPFARWVSSVMEYDHLFISSHYNRQFLYDWIPQENFVHVYSHLTRNDSGQKNYIHTDVEQKDFNIITRKIRDEITKKVPKSTKRNVIIENIPYVKVTPPVSVYQKIFEPVKIEKISHGKILFLPDKIGTPKINKQVHDHLKGERDILVTGDNKCNLPDENILFQDPQYVDKVYKYILSHIQGATIVITPCSHWTFLANLQKVPVFSWCKNPGPYKPGGIYNFGNPNCHTMYFDKHMGIEKLLNQIDWVLENVKEE